MLCDRTENGGLGGVVNGTVSLQAGQVLLIVVGQVGLPGGYGATFVLTANQSLIVAGGGGGGFFANLASPLPSTHEIHNADTRICNHPAIHRGSDIAANVLSAANKVGSEAGSSISVWQTVAESDPWSGGQIGAGNATGFISGNAAVGAGFSAIIGSKEATPPSLFT